MTTPLKTAFDLQCVMQAFVTTHCPNKGNVTLENVYWFVACQVALELQQSSVKDIAHHLLNGCEKINDDYVVGWLGSCYEVNFNNDEEGGVVECFVDFDAAFRCHYGIK